MAKYDYKKYDYKHILERIIWNNYISHPNEPSFFWEIIGEPTEYNRGELYPKGTLLDVSPMIFSYTIPDTKPLSWKELSLKLGLNVEYLVSDGHDCKKCPDYKNCKAYFKDDPKQNACNYWYKEVDGTVYQQNIEKYTIKEDDEENK